jgi:hypothetical protein
MARRAGERELAGRARELAGCGGTSALLDAREAERGNSAMGMRRAPRKK